MENIPRASIHVGKPANSFSASEGAEPERRGWDEEMYIYKNNSDRDNHYDFSRSKFNFEINSKGEIMPLGSNPIPLHERVMHRLEKLKFKPYYKKDHSEVIADNSPNCTLTMIFSGDHDTLHRLAYGDQDVDLTLQKSNANITIQQGIYDWARDTYQFVCEKYGQENVIGFDVHLDETTPHAQVQIIPVAKTKTRGRIGYQYQKKDNPSVVLSTAKWKKLPKEKQKEYDKVQKPKEEKECVSYAEVFGKNKYEVRATYSNLHTEYHDKVGYKYGLERGFTEDELTEDEQRGRVHKDKHILEAERLAKENVAQMQTEVSALEAKKTEIEQQTKDAEQRKDEAEKDAKAAELFKELANIAEVKLPFPKFKIDELITNAQNTINDELAIPIKLMQQKEWKQERQKNIRQTLTDLQTNLGVAKGEYTEEIKSHCKEIFKYYREELKKLVKENEALRKENKTLSVNNSSLQKENRQLKDKISKIDANAIERLRKEKDAKFEELRGKYNNLVGDYNNLADKHNDLLATKKQFQEFMDWLSKHPEIQEIIETTIQEELKKQQELAEAKEKAKIELREKCITNAQTEIQNFGKSGRNDYTDSDQISCVLCGIIAIADKLGIDATLKSGCERATQELLDGVYWFNYRPMQKNIAEWRTPQMVHAIGGITDEMVDAFKQYIAGVQPVASVGGTNGAANTLTNWDGSEVTNGWRAPERPNFLYYSKKKGGGLSL